MFKTLADRLESEALGDIEPHDFPVFRIQPGEGVGQDVDLLAPAGHLAGAGLAQGQRVEYPSALTSE